MPDLLPHPADPIGGDPDPCCVKLILHDLEAVAHEIVQVEILGLGEPIIGEFDHLYPVQDEHPHCAANLL